MTLFRILLAVLSIAGSPSHADTTLKTETYGIHLFFNEQEFVDVITITYDKTGAAKGDMHVPNDFDGPLDNLIMSGDQITFDLFVPKNASRPADLIFHYEGRFFDSSKKQIIGYVTLKGDTAFVASFTGFIRP